MAKVKRPQSDATADRYQALADSGMWGETFDAGKARKFAKLLERMAVDNDNVADALITTDVWLSGWDDDFGICFNTVITGERELGDVFERTMGLEARMDEDVNGNGPTRNIGDGFLLLQAELNRYLSNHMLPDAVIRDVLLCYTVSYRNAVRQTVDSFLSKFWSHHNDYDMTAPAMLLCRYAFAFGYAEKIKHLMAKGKYTARNDAPYKHVHMAHRNALEYSGETNVLPRPPASATRPELAWLVMDAYQAGMKVKPGTIPTEESA